MRRILSAVLLSFSVLASAQTLYKVFPAGPPGSVDVNPADMNNSDVYGGYAAIGGIGKLFVGKYNGTYTFLDPPNGASRGGLNGIGDAGWAAGFCQVNSRARGCVWESNGTPHLWPLVQGYDASTASHTNSSSNACGLIYNNGSYGVAARWSLANGVALLPILPGESFSDCRKILDDGTVVGTCGHGSGSNIAWRGVKWLPSNLMLELLPLSGSPGVDIWDANQAGDVVGASTPQYYATIWRNEQPSKLPMPNGASQTLAMSIDDNGNAVGAYIISSNQGACYWPVSGGVVDLDTRIDPSTPGWHLTAATAISNSGMMLGYGSFFGGNSTAVILVPVDSALVGVTDIQVNLGYVRQGDYHSLSAIDGDTLQVARFFVPNLPSRIQYSVSGTTTFGDLSALTLETYGKMGQPGAFTETLELFNFDSGNYDPTDVRSVSFGAANQQVDLTGTGDVSRYRRTDGLLRARLTVVQSGPSTNSGWWAAHDKIDWKVRP
ncbi:MAG: hypothetical protein JSS66_01890 [Armatimonadetes bacterium]|nr:hypothetical protein [Armatimonadota bacterium]